MDKPPVHEPLTLKVMRLRRPQADMPTTLLLVSDNISSFPELLLPMSLPQTHVGECFQGYMHLANGGPVAVINVVMRVELQINATRHVLFDNASEPTRIEPGSFFDTHVTHELALGGGYALTCKVSYHLAGGVHAEPLIFKRNYRFSVTQPLAISHRVAQLERQLIAECLVTNDTDGPLFLTSARLDCVDGFEAKSLTEFSSPAGGTSGAGAGHGLVPCSKGKAGELRPAALLRHGGACRVAFIVTPKSETIDVAYCRDLRSLGSLALGWQVPDGASGCVEGYQLRLQPYAATALDMHVVSSPSQVQVEEPFSLDVEVVNRSSRAVEPSIVLDLRQMVGVRAQGATRLSVGRIEAYCTARLPLQLIPTSPGMHALRGVSLVDELTQMHAEFDVLSEVLVC
eukprot:NODE_8060_length_1526_cov_9.127234.p1 GENE.NODE_8060_length_1526_cov_9.127234~~NODE_8060_length_1526_cov_9.127234.p1  ORF type:complete len:400 (-),score=127.46 NODE_8060_length_1526_cov_9.127234:273-1472(-)